MASGALINLWVLGMTLVMLTGLNAPLGVLALALAGTSTALVLRPELSWLGRPEAMWLWSALLVLQFLADLYFVPVTVRDRPYLHEARVLNAHLHARLQSFLRPLAAALVLAALPSPLSAQGAAILGFISGTAIYWATAWVREQVAISRGSVILLIVEMAKSLGALTVAVLTGVLAPLAFGLLLCLMLPIGLWAGRLRREQRRYPAYGGSVAPEDS